MSNRKLAKRACDGCKIRKIKCTEIAPCDGCMAAGIACTFVKQSVARGPRRPRKTTLEAINRTQQQWEDRVLAEPAPQVPIVQTKVESESPFAPNKIAALVLQLCIYRLRVYPIWPIIKVERLVAALQGPAPDIEVLALAYAVAAATIAQIRTSSLDEPGQVTAEMMEAQCQQAKAQRNRSQTPDLTTVRIPFFLHVYYENLEPGGLKSITYLREAIAVAHMLGLHRESYYVNVHPEEQEIRRRTMWLLFVNERSISILHKLPVTIRMSIAFPSTNDTDEKEVLMAYQKLVAMFWNFDQAGIFEQLDNQDFEFSNLDSSSQSTQARALAEVRKQLDQDTESSYRMSDVQALEIAVTRQWMRIIIWRLSHSHGFLSQGPDGAASSINDPIVIAKEFLVVIGHLPESALESHGLTLETKIFEIASSVADALALGATTPSQHDHLDLKVAQDILMRLQQLLSHNKRLKNRLGEKLSGFEEMGYLDSGFAFTQSHTPEDSPLKNIEIEKVLQNDGFDFTNMFASAESPETGSTIDVRTANLPLSGADQLQQQQTSLGDLEFPSPGIQRFDLQDAFEQLFPDTICESSQGPTVEIPFSATQNGLRLWQDINFNADAPETGPPAFGEHSEKTTSISANNVHQSSNYSKHRDIEVPDPSHFSLWYMQKR